MRMNKFNLLLLLMKIVLKWQITKESQVTACSVDPVHDQLIISYGKIIILYDIITGVEIRRCEKHTQDVTCLAFRKDGIWFASGA